jgi:O-antigen ligase
MNPALRPVFVCVWLLVLFTFSAPGRDGPNDLGSLDLIALGKVAVRGLSLLVLGYAVFTADRSRRDRVLSVLLPWGIFAGWAIVSVLWSALPAVTLGQCNGLIDLVLLAAACALLWRGPADTEAILRHLTVVSLVFTTIILAVDFIRPDLSGLDREDGEIETGASGMIHPTTAGATASLGLVLLLGCRLLWGWRWTGWLMLPGVAIHVAVLLKANSRMALGMAAAAVLSLAVAFMPRRYLAALALAVGLLGAVYLTVDPSLSLSESAIQKASRFLQRGESSELLYKLTGRTDLWEAIWASFLQSPVIGHGYFVTSKNGLLDVWSGPANRTAHNIFLQVMVTTGLVGLTLFLWAMLQAGNGVVRGLSAGEENGRVGGLLLVIALWYAGWSQLAESFMGGVLPEAVVFFALLGLGLGPLASGVDGARVVAEGGPA